MQIGSIHDQIYLEIAFIKLSIVLTSKRRKTTQRDLNGISYFFNVSYLPFC